ncbi:hypothetical protein [Streptomyces sp. 8L]|uniref:hypothetical protein n=1 Tax=Streptomyces sp. 8L TaxID=2877242 RepID=UPI001CD32636|nr:hypothetical protein [Streptomyces sp. 8L]MCA1223390.1 hypothetical protein [Streptomyces sp. 8L]
MRRMISTALVASVVAVLIGSSPASAAPTVDRRVGTCTHARGGGCAPSISVEYWYAKGAKTRRVSWVYTGTNSKTRRSARWMYRKPGARTYKVASGWKQGRLEPARNGSISFTWASWGKGHHTGAAYPVGTSFCAEFKGGKRVCTKVK